MLQVSGKGPHRHPPSGEDPDALRRRAGVDHAGADQDVRAPEEQEPHPTPEALVTGQCAACGLHTTRAHQKREGDLGVEG